MNQERKFKLRRNTYLIALLLVAAAAIYGFYSNYKQTGSFTNGVDLLMRKQEVVLTDPALEIKKGDKVNIDFVGYVDGEEVKDGSTDGHGVRLTVGSGRLLGDMEEQLVGHHPGDHFTMTLTFPEDFKRKELQGKEATIDMTVNGIYGYEDEEDQ